MKMLITLSLILLSSSSFTKDSDKISDYELILDAYFNSQQNTTHLLTKPYIDSKKSCARKFQYNKGFSVKRYGPLKKIVKDGDLAGAKVVSYKKNKSYVLYGYDLYPNNTNSNLNSKYRFYYFKSLRPYKDHDKRPLIIISPSIKGIKTGRISGIENKWAKYFAKNGIDSIVTDLDEDIFIKSRPLNKVDDWIISQIVGLRMTLDFVHKNLSHDVDINKIGALGASLGGIRTALFMAFEPDRIKAGAIIASGGHFADLWVTSEQKMVAGYRKYRIKEENVPGKNKKEKRENLYHYVKQITCTDPIFFTGLRPNFSDDIKMYIAGDDVKVPTKVQLELWKALGMPTNVEMTNLNHRKTILLGSLTQRKELYYFFDYKLNL